MGKSGTEQLQVILTYQDRLSGRAPRTVQALRSIESQARRTVSAVERVNKALGRRTAAGRLPAQARGPAREEMRNATALIRQRRESLKLQEAEASLALKSDRAHTDGLTRRLRAMREEVRLRRDRAGLQFDNLRLNTGSELANLRILRERLAARRAIIRQYQQEQNLQNGGNLLPGLAVGAAGLKTLSAAQGGVGAAGDFESSMEDLKLSIEELGPDRTINLSKLNSEMAEFERIGVRLGNALPGTTEDFVQMFATLKQGGLSTRTILDGTGEAVADLAVITHSVPKELALPFAQYSQQYHLTGDDSKKLADTLGRLKFATGLDPAELIEGSKFFQLRAGAPLGLTGLQGAEQGGRLLATLRAYGLEGGVGGRELGSFVSHLSFKSKPQQKALAELRGKGIDLEFFGKKGEFLGFENAFAQMEKLRKLSSKDFIRLGGTLFTQEGLAPSTIMMQAGVEGWKEINARIDRIPPQQELINQKTATYNAKLEAVQGTLENLKVTVFTPALDELKPMLDTANAWAGSAQEFAKSHPDLSKNVTLLIALGGASLTAYAAIRTLTIAWKGLQFFDTLSRTSNILELLTGINSGSRLAAGQLAGVTTKATGLRGALASLNNPVAISIGLTAASIFTISEIMELYQVMEEKRKADAALASANAGGLATIGKAREEFGRMGQPVPREIWTAQAGGALAKLNGRGELKDALGGWTLGGGLFQAWRLGNFLTGAGALFPDNESYAFGPRRFAPTVAAETFRRQTPELREPEIMAEFRRMLGGLNLTADERGRVDKALQIAFPDSFSKSSAAAAEAIGKLPEPTSQAGKALSEIVGPARELPSAFNYLGGEIFALGGRINGLEIRPPSVVIGGDTGGASGGKGRTGYKGKLGIDYLHPYDNSAVGSVVHSDGAVNLHRGNVVFPARLSRRSPGDWLESAEAIRGEGAGAVDYSAFRAGGGREITVYVGGVHVSGGADPHATGTAVAAEVERQVREALDRLAAVEADIYNPRFIANMTAREIGWQRERA